MRVIICSDSHGRLEYFQKMMDIEKPDVVVFAGDHSTDAIDMSYVYPDVTFHIVRGNTDFMDYSTEDELVFTINKKRIYLTHGHLFGVKMHMDDIVNRAKEKKADICIFGHTHREYIEEKNGIKFINPGALQDKKYILWAENEFIEKKVK